MTELKEGTKKVLLKVGYIVFFVICNYCGIFIQKIGYKKYGHNYEMIIRILMLFNIILMFDFILHVVKRYLSSGEITFLKGISYTDMNICMIGLKRGKFSFTILSLIYSLINCNDNFFVIIGNLFACILFYVIIYEIFMLYFLLEENFKKTRIILYILLGIIILFGLVKLFYMDTSNLSLSILNSSLVKILLFNLYRLSWIQFIVFIILSIFLVYSINKVHVYELKYNFAKGKFNCLKDFIYKNSHCKSKIYASLLKDYFSLMRNAGYIILQVVTIGLYGIVFIYANDPTIYMVIGLINIYLETVYSQQLYEIESQNFELYKQLPVKYKSFVLSKICSTSVLPILKVSIIYLIKSIINIKILGVWILLILFTIVLSIYFNSILIMFYPNTRRTDIPMLIGNLLLILPIVPLVVVYFGYKNGYKNWNDYFYENRSR